MDTVVGKTCPYCQTPIKPGAPVIVCSACGMPHHAECWQENGRCTTFGCSGNPANNHPNDLPPASVPPPPPPANVPMGMAPRPGAGRPKAGTVIGVLFLVFAGIGLLSQLHTLADLAGHSPNPAYQMYPSWFMSYSLSFSVISIVFMIILGIGLLRLARWARKWTVIWLICAAVIGIASTLVAVSVINFAALIAKVPAQSAPLIKIVMIVVLIITIAFTIVIYGLMVYFLTRPEVVAAYDGQNR